MKILVIGSGGREHALAKKFMESPQVEKVFVAPGNSGMKKDGIQIVGISELSNDELVEFAQKENIDLSFVGPETALMNGVVDAFEEKNLIIFGPRKKAAELEGSKDFAKSIMKKYGVPTADYATFDSLEPALSHLKQHGVPIVIKADGLAAGKGVTVAFDIASARAALADIFSGSQGRVVIEEFLDGEEFSLFSFVHQGKIYPMPIAQDHKRAFDGDKGPNTGGMGAYSPVPHLPKEVINEALEKVVKPTVAGLINEENSFTGVLYAGLILTADGVKTIEFNARFGDPETQVVLPRLKSDLAQAIIDILAGDVPTLEWLETGVTLGVVVASEGYPAQAKTGSILPDIPKELNVYYAGVTENEANQLVSSGGRVYLLSESGKDIASTQKSLYDKLDKLDNQGLFYRHDIGSKAVK
ncbi:phosphoribosylamine--glycine ligase [Lactococcus cremoris]|uniref:Phosphoribosylamine--glycine ligase n=1 Tax=Lactococcus lactis subsp. cremoris TaxID=1359 RepID=A0A1V0PG23_LACLC|nr:phosphoribosylamine--glycine ligase [Lactococcus cremoris]ARE28191.1 phosphoribosylamine--glycine ligase [Lactococcus cremoris]EUN35032.1 phosphoribosylamine-glycine ligase PurD [Lactococcus cremoris subsp. cremoris HP]KZK12361.1 Phosphoribosylamine--glycine ligase [Lactococcus cremoris]KZK39278.1 Phosphoribosylamine--glycine ligase [Lactococcus cremoris]KZK49048.1 Phosphoribosylamine--glycine ligase [Lactococcus cremoris]